MPEPWTMSISACSVCDKDRDPFEIPDEPCGCPYENRATVGVPVIPVSLLKSERAHEAFLAEMHSRGWLTNAKSRDDWTAAIDAAVATAMTKQQGDPS